MRNDARPIGEKLRETEEALNRERGVDRNPTERGHGTPEQHPSRKPFVKDRDMGDEKRSDR